MRILPLAALATLLAGCGDGGTPERVDGGMTVRTIVDSTADPAADPTVGANRDPAVEAISESDVEPETGPTEVEVEVEVADAAPRGRAFDDTSPLDSAPSTAETGVAPTTVDAPANVGIGNINPGIAATLRADPGKTAAGSIEGLVTFGDLSLGGVDIDALLDYLYKPDTDRAKAFKFPKKVKERAGEGKALVGYMIALDFKPKTDDVVIFMLVRDLMSCCFGGAPRPDEWVYVEMRGDHVAELFNYVPVVVRGELIVGRLEDEYGFASGVYTMHADSVEAFAPPRPSLPTQSSQRTER